MKHKIILWNCFIWSQNIIRVIKSRCKRWAGHVAHIGEVRNAYKISDNLKRWILGRKVLTGILQKQDARMQTAFSWLRIEPNGGLLWWTIRFIKDELLDQLGSYRLSRRTAHRVSFIIWSWPILHYFEQHFNEVWLNLCCYRFLHTDLAALSLNFFKRRLSSGEMVCMHVRMLQSLPLGCAALTVTLFVRLLSSCDNYHHENRLF